MGRLSRYFRQSLSDFPQHSGYLMADGKLVTQLKKHYAVKGKRIVGISWQGGADELRRQQRSIPLEQWLPILTQTDLCFVSLQYGDVEQTLKAFREKHAVDILYDNSVNPLEDMDRFAAQVSACDLVITVDNSTAHLAGALGKPTWIFLPELPEWRWMLKRADSPWYPAVRLFRQQAKGDWSAVIQEVASYQSANNLGNLYLKQGDYQTAETYYRQALKNNANHLNAHACLAACLHQQDDFKGAEKYYRKVLKMQKNDVKMMANLCAVLSRQGRFDAAAKLAKDALKLQADLTEGHMTLAFSALIKGQYKKAWPEYEWRKHRPILKERLTKLAQQHLQPVWQGEDIQHKTLLIWPEEGYGDFVFYARFIHDLIAQKVKVVLLCKPSLWPLMQTSFPQAVCIKSGDPLPSFDIHTPVMSLAACFKTELSTIPQTCPYLTVDKKLCTKWQRRMAKIKGKRIGIAWAGHSSNPTDRERSLNLELLKPLFKQKETQFFSLQVGEATTQINTLGLDKSVKDLSPQLTDFAETAAAISQLDLVICADTVIAHLAGALNKPVWLLLPAVPDWRWMLKREDSPWYPSMRLFRQQKVGDWKSVIKQVRGVKIKRV